MGSRRDRRSQTAFPLSSRGSYLASMNVEELTPRSLPASKAHLIEDSLLPKLLPADGLVMASPNNVHINQRAYGCSSSTKRHGNMSPVPRALSGGLLRCTLFTGGLGVPQRTSSQERERLRC